MQMCMKSRALLLLECTLFLFLFFSVQKNLMQDGPPTLHARESSWIYGSSLDPDLFITSFFHAIEGFYLDLCTPE